MRSEYGLPADHDFSDISNMELRSYVEHIKRSMPDAGQNMIKGILRGEGIHVPLARIRKGMHF